jgi:hypothetical protein
MTVHYVDFAAAARIKLARDRVTALEGHPEDIGTWCAGVLRGGEDDCVTRYFDQVTCRACLAVMAVAGIGNEQDEETAQ